MAKAPIPKKAVGPEDEEDHQEPEGNKVDPLVREKGHGEPRDHADNESRQGRADNIAHPAHYYHQKEVDEAEIVGVGLKGIEEGQADAPGPGRGNGQGEGNHADPVKVDTVQLGGLGLLPGGPDGHARVSLFQEEIYCRYPREGQSEADEVGILKIKRAQDQGAAGIGRRQHPGVGLPDEDHDVFQDNGQA